jgi:hypothetical protein
MTPKEKAKELVDKYWDLGGMDVYIAKVCALIAVDEILSLSCINDFNGYTNKNTEKYWQEVKTEIQKR